ncbi:MAG: hypothetical protein K2W96_02210 [Gemmataceae bacterium]|nr:hypothetical protein [Gemmataceae bacterium]
MATVTIDCPFCHTSNDPSATGGYCDSCGRRLPVSSAYMHTTRTARRVRTDEPGEALKPRRQTAESLVAAAVLRLVLGMALVFIGPLVLAKVPDYYLPWLMLATVAGAGAFYALSFVARTQPFAAAVASVAVFVAGWAAVLVAYPPALPLAGADALLLLWLLRTVAISRDDRL